MYNGYQYYVTKIQQAYSQAIKLQEKIKLLNEIGENCRLQQFFVNGRKGVAIISVNDVRTFIDQPALSKETFSIVFFCGQDCCFIPVYYMVQGDGVLNLWQSLMLKSHETKTILFPQRSTKSPLTLTDISNLTRTIPNTTNSL